MSRYYEMALRVRGAKPERVDAVKQGAAKEWSFEDWHAVETPDNPTSFGSSGRDNLCGGEGEEEFAERLAKTIWKANAGFCQVEVRATYLEALPYEVYSFDQEAFAALTGHQNDKTDTARATSHYPEMSRPIPGRAIWAFAKSIGTMDGVGVSEATRVICFSTDATCRTVGPCFAIRLSVRPSVLPSEPTKEPEQ